jgi:group I intron endonuclease
LKGCIYKVTNKVNGKIYIGQTIKKPETRWRNHICSAGKGSNYAFHRAICKHGKDAFIWEVIVIADETNLNSLEVFYIKQFKSLVPNGYNLTEGGEGKRGWNPSPETRAKISIAHIGMKHSSETRVKMSIAKTGKTRKKHTPETKAKIRTACLGRNLGRKVSLETRAKISAANTGKKRSPESRAKISAACIGKKHGPYKPKRCKVGIE